jgi:hypothetical protein
MRTIKLVVVAALVSAGIVLVPSAPAATPNCTGVVTAPQKNVVAGPGCVLEGTHVSGNVSVAPNGSLDAEDATIDGSLTIANTSSDSRVCDTTVGGNVLILQNSGAISFGGGACSFSGSTAGRDLHFERNTGSVDFDGFVARDMTVVRNKTADPVFLSGGTVGRDLICGGNTPAPDPGSLSVDGKTKGGQCETTASTSCPATGCALSLDSAPGDAHADVTVPGGGDAGPLKLTFSPPPSDDGCFGGEGGSTPIGSVLTIVPPKGYTSSNPIVVHITWGDGETTFTIDAICKSVNGKPPFTEIPMCGDGGTAVPTLAPEDTPCWADDPEGGVDVYLASDDPALSGH